MMETYNMYLQTQLRQLTCISSQDSSHGTPSQA